MENIDYLDNIKKYSNEIFQELGLGYKEHIYVNAMCVNLSRNKYLYRTEVIVPIMYQGVQLGYERADIVIYEPINCVIEFKSQTQSLSKKEITQLIKYQNNLNINDGILINFGNNNGKLEYLENSLVKKVEVSITSQETSTLEKSLDIANLDISDDSSKKVIAVF